MAARSSSAFVFSSGPGSAGITKAEDGGVNNCPSSSKRGAQDAAHAAHMKTQNAIAAIFLNFFPLLYYRSG